MSEMAKTRKKEKAAPVNPATDQQVQVEIPINRIEVVPVRHLRPLHPADARTLAQIAIALREDGEELEDGQAVADSDLALRWILQRVRRG